MTQRLAGLNKMKRVLYFHIQIIPYCVTIYKINYSLIGWGLPDFLLKDVFQIPIVYYDSCSYQIQHREY